MHLIRRLVIQRLMRPRSIVVNEVAIKSVADFADRRVSVRVDIFVLHRPPQSFGEYVVHASSSSIHADQYVALFQNVRVVLVGVLHSLIGVVNVWRSMVKRFLQGLDAERGFHRGRNAPCQDGARVPIDDGGKVAESAVDPDVGNIGAPHFIGSRDVVVPQEVRIHLVSDEWNACSWLRIYGFEPEDTPERSQAILADLNAMIALQDENQLQHAVLRMIRVLAVESGEDAQILFVQRNRCRVQTRAGDAENIRLSSERD